MHKNLLLIVAFVALLLGGLYLLGPDKDPVPAGKDAPGQAELIALDSSMKSGKALFSVYGDRPPAPDMAFLDEQGDKVTLADFKGQSLLVNFWATWCVPCREEMPELDALQRDKGGDDFKVVIISVDRGGLAASRKFLDDIGVKNLALYYDEKGRLARKMKSIGFPSTVLVTRDSKQFGMLTGPAHWNSPSAHQLIDRLRREGR